MMDNSMQERFDEIELPLDYWRRAGQRGMPQYTPENCDRAESILKNLLSELVRIGEHAATSTKLEAIESSVVALNTLNANVAGLIETGERENLCELYDQIAVAVGLDPSEYGEGDGIASEWREW